MIAEFGHYALVLALVLALARKNAQRSNRDGRIFESTLRIGA
jgi:hypothetical protein